VSRPRFVSCVPIKVAATPTSWERGSEIMEEKQGESRGQSNQMYTNQQFQEIIRKQINSYILSIYQYILQILVISTLENYFAICLNLYKFWGILEHYFTICIYLQNCKIYKIDHICSIYKKNNVQKGTGITIVIELTLKIHIFSKERTCYSNFLIHIEINPSRGIDFPSTWHSHSLQTKNYPSEGSSMLLLPQQRAVYGGSSGLLDWLYATATAAHDKSLFINCIVNEEICISFYSPAGLEWLKVWNKCGKLYFSTCEAGWVNYLGLISISLYISELI